MRDGSIKQGDVFWVAPDLLRPAVEGVPHPHVVIQEDVLNQSRIPTTVICGISSNPRRANEPGNVLLEPGEAGLARASTVIVSQVCTIEKAALSRWIGRLSGERVQQIIDGLRFLQASYFSRD